MRLLLIRHATASPRGALTDEGIEEARTLAVQLQSLGVVPEVLLSTNQPEARDTAGHLAASGLRTRPGAVLRAQTAADWFEPLLDELQSASSAESVAIVGCEPQLSQIVARSTGTRHRPLGRAEALALTGEDLGQLRRGRAEVEFRTGLQGEPEEVLRDKLHSKTAVATLLAGFTFAALVELLTRDALSGLQAAATALLTLSFGLLVACVYVYDQLGLPAGFWSAAEPSVSGQQGVRARLLGGLEHAGHGMRIWTSRRAAARSARFAFDDAYRTHGVVFAYMVWTWRWMFTPAVAAGAGGFILLLVASDRPGLIAGGIAALALAVGLYLALRPRLGPD